MRPRSPQARRAAFFAFLALGSSLAACAAAERLIESAFGKGALDGGLHEGEWTYWHDNGQMRAKGNYEDDHQIGPWTYWYPNGNVEWEGSFSSDRIHGPSTFYHDNGQRKAEGMYVEGYEDGPWSIWSRSGARTQSGGYLRGRQDLRWEYFHGDGSFLATGYYFHGEKVGVWQYWDADETRYERVFPLPQKTDVVNEFWDDGTVRREGFQQPAGKTGRWLTWHSNGRPRASGLFVNGTAEGRWYFWGADGGLVGLGSMSGGRFTGKWRVFENGVETTVSGSSLPSPVSTGGAWSADGLASRGDVGAAIATWAGEAASPASDVVDQTADPAVSEPSSALLAVAERRPDISLRRQPWTTSERKAMDYLITRYKEGEAAAKPPPGSRYGKRSTKRKQKVAESEGDTALSDPLLNKPLPVTQFRNGQGEWIDLNSFKGKKNVVLVVLRGFAREVCVYCVTQTEAMAESIGEFQSRDAEVFVVYPGERNRLDAFMDAYQSVTKLEGEIPLGVLYDPSMALVDRMGISSELSIPSTFVLDKSGIVKYAYVGKTIEDRPAAKKILEVVDGLQAP